MKSSTTFATPARDLLGHWRDYLEITKPKVVLLLVFTALAGMALAVPGWLPLRETVFGLLGIGLAASSAAAINHVIDQRADAIMKRTAHRPIPQGALSTRQCLVFAGALGVVAMVMLTVLVNPLTAVLTFLSLIGYAVVYTVWLKRATPQNIVIGGAAGAMPPVLGWAAVTGEVTAGALLLFLIVFVWTPPHFWALAIHRRDDYAKVDIPMLPVTHGIPHTRVQIFLYTVLLVIVTLFPYLIGMSGPLYLAGAVVLGTMFLYHAAKLFDDSAERQPIRTFVFSINYLMWLFGIMLADHWLPSPVRAPALSGARLSSGRRPSVRPLVVRVAPSRRSPAGFPSERSPAAGVASPPGVCAPGIDPRLRLVAHPVALVDDRTLPQRRLGAVGRAPDQVCADRRGEQQEEHDQQRLGDDQAAALLGGEVHRHADHDEAHAEGAGLGRGVHAHEHVRQAQHAEPGDGAEQPAEQQQDTGGDLAHEVRPLSFPPGGGVDGSSMRTSAPTPGMPGRGAGESSEVVSGMPSSASGERASPT